MEIQAIIASLEKQHRIRHVARAFRHGLDIGPDGNAAVGFAAGLAAKAHAGQVRRYTGEPYAVHPLAVARKVAAYFPVAMAVSAAVLHDVVEDTEVTLKDLRRARYVGPYVACLVDDLTDVSRPEDGNRAARKAIDRAHTAKAHPMAKLIKLADLIDNSRDIFAMDPGFAPVYAAEKAALLNEALQPVAEPSTALELAHSRLHAQARELVDGFLANQAKAA